MDKALIWFLIALLLGCLAGGMLLYAQRMDELFPEGGATFLGRPVQAWLNDLRSEDQTVSQEARDKLGTMGPANRDAVPELTQALADPHLLVRTTAARALDRIGSAARPVNSPLALPAPDALDVDVRSMRQARSGGEGQAMTRRAFATGMSDR